MKKVINWTFGAFFRSIGRTFAFLFIGTIIAFILLKCGFRIPRLFPIMQVNAETITTIDNEAENFKFAVQGMSMPTDTNVCYPGFKYSYDFTPFLKPITPVEDDSVLQISGRGGFKTSDIFKNDPNTFKKNFYRLEFAYTSSSIVFKVNQTYNVSFLVSSSVANLLNSAGWTGATTYKFQNFDNDNYWRFDSNIPVSYLITSNGGNMYWVTFTFKISSNYTRGPYGVLFELYIPNTQYVQCNNNDNNYYGEPNWFYINNAIIQDSNIDYSLLTFPTENVKDNYWSNTDYVNPSSSGGSGETGGTTNEDINNSINDMNDSINNDNIDDANNEANGFFEGFTSEDNGGLSGIITAPLNSINAMLSDSCSPLTTSFKGKEIKLPCGTEFYNSMGEVRTFLNMLEGGFLSYMILRKLYFLIQKLKNPEDDRVEVMNL